MASAEGTHWWYTGLHDLVLRSVRREAANRPIPLEILDAGCGTGRLCQLLEPFGNVTGCDFHPLAVAAATRRGVGRVECWDLASDPLGNERFDLITFMDVLYHQGVPDDAVVIANLHRALRPRGLLILQVAAFESLRGGHDLAVHTRRRYRCGEIILLLEAAGFLVEFASYRLLPLFLPMFVRRHFGPHGAPESDLEVKCSGWLNRKLGTYVRCENRLLCGGFRFPFGTSIFAISRKTDQSEPYLGLPANRPPQRSSPI